MADKIEKKVVEIGAEKWVEKGEKTNYTPFNPKDIPKENKDLSKVEKALEVGYTTTEKKPENKPEPVSGAHTWFDKDGQERLNNNPGTYNVNKVEAGKEIPKWLNEDQRKNFFGRLFQNISKRLLWPNNQ